MKDLIIDFRISGYVNELVKQLHDKYPHTEWSGIGRLVKKGGYYELVDIKFPEQRNTSGETEMTKKGLDDLVERVFEEDPANMNEWMVWLHSHHSMSCFWSGTDEAAKNSFNDGNTRFWFSVVTAYKRTNGNIVPDYKCALNIFKPIFIEFDIPVSVGEFDEMEYMKKITPKFKLLVESIANLEKKRDESIASEIVFRDEQLARLVKNSEPSEENILELLSIFNIEDNADNREICIELIQENKNKGYDLLVESYNNVCERNIEKLKKEFIDAKQETIKYFGGTSFGEKIKELEDNILPSYSLLNFGKKKEKRKRKTEGTGRKGRWVGKEFIPNPAGTEYEFPDEEFDDDQYEDDDDYYRKNKNRFDRD